MVKHTESEGLIEKICCLFEKYINVIRECVDDLTNFEHKIEGLLLEK